jgi:addiction module HigA family antidote
MAQMHSPPHPGKVLREWFGDIEVSKVAEQLKVSRVTLSRLLNGGAGMSADMALRLEAALGTSPEMWMGLQADYDLWKARQKVRPDVRPILRAA